MLESLFIIKVHARGSATLLKETPTQVFSCEYCDIFKNSFLIEHLLWLLLSDEYLIDCSRSFWNEASSNYAGNKAILKKLYSKGKLHLNLALWSYLPNSSFYKTNDFGSTSSLLWNPWHKIWRTNYEHWIPKKHEVLKKTGTNKIYWLSCKKDFELNEPIVRRLSIVTLF